VLVRIFALWQSRTSTSVNLSLCEACSILELKEIVCLVHDFRELCLH